MVSVGFFILGTLFGCVLALLYKKVARWLLVRVLPAQHLQEHPVRYRHTPKSIKETARGN